MIREASISGIIMGVLFTLGIVAIIYVGTIPLRANAAGTNDAMAEPSSAHADESVDERLAECLIENASVFLSEYGDRMHEELSSGILDAYALNNGTYGSLAASYAEGMCASLEYRQRFLHDRQ